MFLDSRSWNRLQPPARNCSRRKCQNPVSLTGFFRARCAARSQTLEGISFEGAWSRLEGFLKNRKPSVFDCCQVVAHECEFQFRLVFLFIRQCKWADFDFFFLLDRLSGRPWRSLPGLVGLLRLRE